MDCSNACEHNGEGEPDEGESLGDADNDGQMTDHADGGMSDGALREHSGDGAHHDDMQGDGNGNDGNGTNDGNANNDGNGTNDGDANNDGDGTNDGNGTNDGGGNSDGNGNKDGSGTNDGGGGESGLSEGSKDTGDPNSRGNEPLFFAGGCGCQTTPMRGSFLLWLLLLGVGLLLQRRSRRISRF